MQESPSKDTAPSVFDKIKITVVNNAIRFIDENDEYPIASFYQVNDYNANATIFTGVIDGQLRAMFLSVYEKERFKYFAEHEIAQALQTLINTSPDGVYVLAAFSGELKLRDDCGEWCIESEDTKHFTISKSFVDGALQVVAPDGGDGWITENILARFNPTSERMNQYLSQLYLYCEMPKHMLPLQGIASDAVTLNYVIH